MLVTLVSTLALLHRGESWHMTGTLSEACSCAVPCPCNFESSPTREFCYAIVAMHIDKGTYGNVNLDGLEIGGANGAKGYVFFVDDKATPEQEKALHQIATLIFAKAVKANGFADPSKAPPDLR